MLMTEELLRWAEEDSVLSALEFECGTIQQTTAVNDVGAAGTRAPLPIPSLVSTTPKATGLGTSMIAATVSTNPIKHNIPSPTRSANASTQSQCITTVPSSPTNTAALRGFPSSQSLFNTLSSSSGQVPKIVVDSTTTTTPPSSIIPRTTSMTSSGTKLRALATAASHVIRNIIAIGACHDPRCLMYYDAEVFTAPLSLSSRQRFASFRRHPGASASSATSQSPSAAAPGGSDSSPVSHHDLVHDDSAEDEDMSLALDPEFDQVRVSRRLFSSPAQQGTPLIEFLVDVLGFLSSSQSPLRSQPETFVCGLILLERMQHASLLARHQCPSGERSMSPCGPLAGFISPPPIFAGPTGLGVVSASPVLNNASQSAAPSAEDRVRLFLDETPAVRLTVENLQSLSSPNSALPSRTPSHTLGAPSDTESTILDVDGNHVALSSQVHFTNGRLSQTALPSTLCAECSDQPGLALHASNVHLFFAAAVLVAMKVREDFCTGPKILAHAASMLRCSSNRSLYWAERCLCDVLHFDVNITVGEYRMMLRQLASHRPLNDDVTTNYMSLFSAA